MAPRMVKKNIASFSVGLRGVSAGEVAVSTASAICYHGQYSERKGGAGKKQG